MTVTAQPAGSGKEGVDFVIIGLIYRNCVTTLFSPLPLSPSETLRDSCYYLFAPCGYASYSTACSCDGFFQPHAPTKKVAFEKSNWTAVPSLNRGPSSPASLRPREQQVKDSGGKMPSSRISVVSLNLNGNEHEEK